MSASLSILAPIPITDAMFISSTAPETDYTAYNAATTYAIGDRCISTVTHRIYESLRATNINHDPTVATNLAGTAPWWLDVGPTNKWAMIDGEVSTQTSIASPLTVVIRPGHFNSMFLAGLDSETLAITVKDAPGGNVIYSYSGSLENSAPGDYYEYYFDPFKPQTDFLVSGIDPYSAAEITLTLTKGSGNVLSGILAMGDLRPLGQTQYGAKAKPKSYSYIKIDDFGNNVIKRRKKAKDISATAWVALSEANAVLDTITELLDVPCVLIGTDLPEYSGLRGFGLVSGEMSYDYPQDCLLSITLQGMI
jgi:hypothetical protein